MLCINLAAIGSSITRVRVLIPGQTSVEFHVKMQCVKIT